MSSQKQPIGVDTEPPRPRYLESSDIQQVVDLLRRFSEQTNSQSTFDQIKNLIARLTG